MGVREPGRVKHFAAGCATGLLIPSRTPASDPPTSLQTFWGDSFWGDSLTWARRDSRYDLGLGRWLKTFGPGLRRRAARLGWRDDPLLESARWPFLFDYVGRMLMLGVGQRADFYARWERWCVRACEDRRDRTPVGEPLFERAGKAVCRLCFQGP